MTNKEMALLVLAIIVVILLFIDVTKESYDAGYRQCLFNSTERVLHET